MLENRDLPPKWVCFRRHVSSEIGGYFLMSCFPTYGAPFYHTPLDMLPVFISIVRPYISLSFDGLSILWEHFLVRTAWF